MANEITVLLGDGKQAYDLLFLFPISTPKQINAANIVVTPSSSLPSLAAEILTATEKSALDAGTSAFWVYRFETAVGLTNAQLIARAQAIYAAALNDFNAWYAATYKYVGTRLNST